MNAYNIFMVVSLTLKELAQQLRLKVFLLEPFELSWITWNDISLRHSTHDCGWCDVKLLKMGACTAQD